jgi:hypothetical protein
MEMAHGQRTAGSISLCGTCGETLVVAEDLSIRLGTPADELKLLEPQDEERFYRTRDRIFLDGPIR